MRHFRRFGGILATAAALCAPAVLRAQAPAQVPAVPMPGHELRSGAAMARWNALRITGPAPTLAQMQSACGVSAPAQEASSEEFQYAGKGLTPPTVSGASTVSAVQANCLLKLFPGKIFVADAAGEGALPDSFDMAYAGRRYAQDETQQALVRTLSFTAPDKSTPILVYCHHTSCQLSYYAAQRIIAAGYGRVLWMREGMAGWKAAGFAFAPDGSSRWNREMNANLSAWYQCVRAQPRPATGTDPTAMALPAIRACRPQENAYYAAIGPWYTDATADGTVTSLRRNVVSSMQIIADNTAAAAKLKAEEDDKDRRWQAIERVTAAAPANQVHMAYEWCESFPWEGAHEHINYFSSVYSAKIPNLDPLDEITYSDLNQQARSGRGGRFGGYINQMNHESVLMFTLCFRDPTEAAAMASKQKFMQGLADKKTKVQDTAWKP